MKRKKKKKKEKESDLFEGKCVCIQPVLPRIYLNNLI